MCACFYIRVFEEQEIPQHSRMLLYCLSLEAARIRTDRVIQCFQPPKQVSPEH